MGQVPRSPNYDLSGEPTLFSYNKKEPIQLFLRVIHFLSLDLNRALKDVSIPKLLPLNFRFVVSVHRRQDSMLAPNHWVNSNYNEQEGQV